MTDDKPMGFEEELILRERFYTDSALERARREAHAWCVSADAREAIDRLEAAARLAGRIEQAEKMHTARCRCQTPMETTPQTRWSGFVDPLCQALRDRLRREGEKG